MPKRQDIYDAAYTALNASTGTNYVTKDLTQSGFDWSMDHYPGCIITDMPERKTRFAYPDATAEDMESEMSISVDGFVREVTLASTALEAKRGDLIADIEKAIFNSTGVDDLILDIIDMEVDTDRNVLEGVGWCNVRFTLRYIYNHLAP